jgi:uncharacterized membrane protein
MKPRTPSRLPKSVGKWDLSDSHKRSLVKTVTWRVTGSTSAVIIAYVVTGSIALSSTIGIAHLIVNTLLYWVHERVWIRVDWGRHDHTT